MKNKEVTDRIKEIRTENGYTQAEFAEILDMSYDGYKKMERGISNVSIDKLALLEERLSVSAEYILFGQKSDFEDICVKVNMLPEIDKLCLMMKLFLHFVKVKKNSLALSKENTSVEPLLKEMYEFFEKKGVLCEDE